MAKGDQQCLGSPGMRVRSLAGHRGLGIQHCCSCGLVPSCGWDLGSDPWPGSSICLGMAKGKKKKNRIRPRESYLYSLGFHFLFYKTGIIIIIPSGVVTGLETQLYKASGTVPDIYST